MSEPNKDEVKKSFLSNQVYDTLKVVAAILPFLGAFYFGLAEIWNLPYGGAVQATFALVASTLSAILIKLSHDYSKYQKALAETVVPSEEITEEPEPEDNIEVETEEPIEVEEETNDEIVE